MLVMRIGLMAAAAAFAYGTWASWSAGFPPEVAIVRGVVAFMAVSFLAYVGELVVATAPPPGRNAGAEGRIRDFRGGRTSAGPGEAGDIDVSGAQAERHFARDEQQAA